MFKRPLLHVKTSAPLRSSDVRKTREELLAFETLPLTPALAKQLAPDGLLVCKASTHLDEPLTIYWAGGNPLWFRQGRKEDGALIPTSYVFDLVPGLLPVLVTAPQVVSNLISGAALFAAGVSERSIRELPDSMEEGSLVAIRAADSPKIVAVGQLAAGKKELLQLDGKGKAVITLHARGDHLWLAGSGVESSPLVGSFVDTSPASSAKSPPTQDEELVSALGSASLSSVEAVASTSEIPAELSTAEVDTALQQALLLSLKALTRTPASFPMPASSIYSSHILPNRPASAGAGVEIKKSSYKKLAGLMKVATKNSWIVTKEVKGELMVMSVNGEHPDITQARSYRTMAQAASQAAAAAPAATDASAASSNSSGDVVVRELFKPSSSIVPLFQSVQHERPDGNLYLAHQLKATLTSYITSHNLSHPRDQKFLKLDPLLSEVLLKKGESLDTMAKEDAHRRLKDGCVAHWSLERKGEERVVKKGSPPLVKVAIRNVGKRQVTLITGHDAYPSLLTSDSLAEELKHRSASSVSVNPIAGSAKKGSTPKMEVMCQGTHDALVLKLLTAKGIPKQYIEVDTTKSKR